MRRSLEAPITSGGVNSAILHYGGIPYSPCHPERVFLREGPLQLAGGTCPAGDCTGPSTRKKRGLRMTVVFLTRDSFRYSRSLQFGPTPIST